VFQALGLSARLDLRNSIMILPLVPGVAIAAMCPIDDSSISELGSNSFDRFECGDIGGRACTVVD